MQLPLPPPGFVPVPAPFNFWDFLCLYLVLLEVVVLALPRRISDRVLEALFPILRRMR